MKNFPFYGHGIGLSFEQPRISTAMSLPGDVVEENMVFGVEAFLALEGVGSAFFEDIVIVTRDAPELLTRTPIISGELPPRACASRCSGPRITVKKGSQPATGHPSETDAAGSGRLTLRPLDPWSGEIAPSTRCRAPSCGYPPPGRPLAFP